MSQRAKLRIIAATAFVVCVVGLSFVDFHRDEIGWVIFAIGVLMLVAGFIYRSNIRRRL